MVLCLHDGGEGAEKERTIMFPQYDSSTDPEVVRWVNMFKSLRRKEAKENYEKMYKESLSEQEQKAFEFSEKLMNMLSEYDMRLVYDEQEKHFYVTTYDTKISKFMDLLKWSRKASCLMSDPLVKWEVVR